MGKKVTIQDIADALGMSRNTVSKAINNSEGLNEATREKILHKALEMGYKQFSYVNALTQAAAACDSQHPTYEGELALFTTKYLPYNHFGSLFLDKFVKEIGQLGFTLSIYRVSEENIREGTFPATFSQERAKAVVCIEIFDKAYADMVCTLELPVLFVDTPACENGERLNADILMMDNETEITRFMHMMAQKGITKIGFIGDYFHCRSFYERYVAYRMAMIMEGLDVDPKFVIRAKDRDVEELGNYLDHLDELPELFICTNDFVAIDAMHLLRQKDRNLVKKVRFLGFDDSYESRTFYPPLSTVHIHTQAMAFSAVQLLVTRMKEPAMEYREVYIASDLVLRESTEF